MSKQESNLIEIGYCTKPHGIKGEFTFVIYEEFYEDLEKGSSIIIQGSSPKSSINGKQKKQKIEKINFGHKIMVRLEGIENRNQVEELVPFSILLDREKIDELHEGEMLLSDYEGLEAIEFGTGRKLGPVVQVYESGAQPILQVGKGRESFEIPLVENFVKEVDLDKKEIHVVVPQFIEV